MDKVKLSPSKLKTLDQCSWIFWQRYFKGFPNEGNSGASRGSVTHYVLECLAKQKRRFVVESMVQANDPFIHQPTKRLVYIHAKKLNVSSDENIEMIKDFILVALKNDFYCEDSLELYLEESFYIEGSNYIINGIIDKLAVYDDRIVLIDYKSSKAKFSKEELNYNYQNLIYSLAAKKRYPNLPVKLIFQFLKFKRSPNQEAPVATDEELKKLEGYFEEVASYIATFDEKKAVAGLAKYNIKNSFLCGKKCGEMNAAGDKPAFICALKYPRLYFRLEDESGKLIKSSFDKSDLEKIKKENQKIVVASYQGCPAFKYLWKTS